MAHQLFVLPYAEDDLEPHVSKETLDFHHGKHHQAYVTKLNDFIPGTKFENATLEIIVKESEGGIYNNGAQVWNHTFYFSQFAKNPSNEPSGKLADAIQENFGSFQEFKEAFNRPAVSLFGSGWVWLVRKHDNSLSIIPESNAGNPMRLSLKPILTLDVWEHAYYLDYQNRRADYIEAFWKIVDWKIIEKRFAG